MPGTVSGRPENDVFVSYSREDSSRVRMLVEAIEKEGWKTFWDQEILPGEDWESQIGIHLDAAPVVIAVWSKLSVKSRYVRSEVNRANKRNVVLPVLIEAVEPPFGLEHIQAADLVEWLAKGGGTLPTRLKSAISRKISYQSANSDADGTLAVSKRPPEDLWIRAGIVVVLLLLLAGGGYYYTLRETSRLSQDVAASDKTAQDAKLAEEAQRLSDAQELAKLRGEATARQQAEPLAGSTQAATPRIDGSTSAAPDTLRPSQRDARDRGSRQPVETVSRASRLFAARINILCTGASCVDANTAANLLSSLGAFAEVHQVPPGQLADTPSIAFAATDGEMAEAVEEILRSVNPRLQITKRLMQLTNDVNIVVRLTTSTER